MVKYQKIYRWRHILYDSIAWWLSSENISRTSHHLWQHGLVVKFRKHIADVTSFMTAWTWWLISGNISLTLHPLWQQGLVVKFRKYIAYVTSFMTAWSGRQFPEKYRLRHILHDRMNLVIIFRKYISWRHILYDSMAWWLILTAWPGG